ncbi:MAG: protein-L-isoaspartate(D-aspartate) O-methyltransferase [Candidatus Lokiarchaeota archaeon]|nr:protein-L-isoaspartate(D-aspartate) O-methyltransferase [Candidatus Lokiarchaeota archaeon]
MSFEEKRKDLIDDLKKRGVLTNAEVIRAMLKVPRHLFLPEEARSSAYMDSPLLIGMNQTISAPHMNAMMCEYLKLEEGDKVLEIGTGSGYHAALCAELVAPDGARTPGHVYTIEYHEELVKNAINNLKVTGYDDRVTVLHADGTLGYPQEAPYDKILVTAASPEKVPQAFKDQLRDGGILCIPAGSKNYGQTLYVVRKHGNVFEIDKKCGVRFVPLVGQYGFEN